jgi:hypothetical protein
MKNPQYVCSICGQDFTRRYNANRHNQTIHSNKAEIVRFLEYLIGRISGKYLPGDPLSYRIKYKNDNKTRFVHENANNLRHEKSDPSLTKTTSYAPNPRQNEIDGKNTDLNNSMAGMNTATNPLDYLHHLNTLIQLQDKKHREFLQKRKIEDKLEDIERMLHDFEDPETVRTRITELRDKYNATRDYVSFNRELDAYRDSLVDRYLRWR